MRVLYIDAYFFFNLLADYLICLSTGRLCSLKLRRRRYLAAALLGAFYALACLPPGPGFLSSLPAKLAAAAAMGALAFGAEARPLRCILAMLLVSCAFGGFLYAVSLALESPVLLSLPRLAAFFLFCYGILKLLSRFRRRWDGAKTASVRLNSFGREAEFSALVDSGNSLRSPETGEGVLIASPAALRPLFSEYSVLLEELEPVELIQAFARLPDYAGKLRLIPYRSLSGGGMLPVFRPQRLLINGVKTDNLLVGISREVRGNGYEAVL